MFRVADHTAVRAGQVLQGRAGRAPVDARLRVVVTGHALSLGVRRSRLAKTGLGRRPSLASRRESPESSYGIVQGHRPRGGPRPATCTSRTLRREPPNWRRLGGRVLVHTQPYLVFHPPRGGTDDPQRAVHPVQHGTQFELLGKLAAFDGVQKLQMRRVRDDVSWHCTQLQSNTCGTVGTMRHPGVSKVSRTGKAGLSPPDPCRRTRARGIREWDRPRGRAGPSACSRPVRPGFPGSCHPRQRQKW